MSETEDEAPLIIPKKCKHWKSQQKITQHQKEKEDEEEGELEASEAEAGEAIIMAINKNINNTMRINSTEEEEVKEAIIL